MKWQGNHFAKMKMKKSQEEEGDQGKQNLPC